MDIAETEVSRLHDAFGALREDLSRQVVGQSALIERLLIALLADGHLLVEDGQTVVIGGVYEFRDRTDMAKVPFLGDIPFLGNLFRNKGRSKEKAELLVFVTPKVMRVSQR